MEVIISRALTEDIPALYDLQLLSFESEAEMIRSRDVPALLESSEHHKKDFSNWITLKAIDPAEKIVGAVRYRQDGDLIEIGRLILILNKTV